MLLATETHNEPVHDEGAVPSPWDALDDTFTLETGVAKLPAPQFT